MNTYLPYIVSVICAVISGVTSYAVARKQAKADMQRLEKQHDLDIEKERERFAMEKEKMEIDQRNQLERLQKELENNLGISITNTLIGEIIKSPDIHQQINQEIKNGIKHKKH